MTTECALQGQSESSGVEITGTHISTAEVSSGACSVLPGMQPIQSGEMHIWEVQVFP